MSLAGVPHHYAPEVFAALKADRPVVALESTIITHGLPYPHNLSVALEVERLIREQGAVPATLAVLDGEIHIGLTESSLERLAKTPEVRKMSARDIAGALVDKAYGSTTVAATMCLAAHAGIEVFVTGGIGGVHRGAELSFDISADLIELAKTKVAVVCAGAKSILDLGLTLEYLETHGVPVWGYQTHEFPAFYARQSGFTLEQRFDTPEAVASAIRYHFALNETGLVVANPIPLESALESAYMNEVIALALEEAQREGIQGKAVTPYLLKHLQVMSEGLALEANQALVFHNAKVGATIAVALNQQKKGAL